MSKVSVRALRYGDRDMVPATMRERLMAAAWMLIGFAGGMAWMGWLSHSHVR